MKYIFIVLFLFASWINLSSQESYDKPFSHRLSLLGNGIINPGLSYGISKEISDTTLENILMLRTANRTYFVSGNVDLYWDPFSHTGIQNYYNLEIERILLSNIYFDYGVGIGVQGRFTGDNYVVNDDFEVSKSAIKLNGYFLGNTYVGLKFKNTETSRTTFVRTHLFLITPYNQTFIPSFTLQIGKEF